MAQSSVRCVNCGKNTASPVWAMYADEAFEGKPQEPFPLHKACFSDNEKITAVRWVADGDNAYARTEEYEMLRYRRAEAPANA